MPGTTVRGFITVGVDALELEAVMSFVPDANGTDWDGEALARVVAEARLTGLPSRLLDQALLDFSRSKEPVRVILAKGQAPEAGVPEEAVWSTEGTPAEFKPFEADALAEAPPPELFRVRVDKVARERTVKKPAALPFLPPKEEKIVEYEKVEVREPVPVDTMVRQSFWASKGTVAGRLMPPKPGKPGKNVFGRALPPDRDDNSGFNLGNGLYKEKSEILVAEDGFIRIGTRWADLVPFRAGTWSLRASDDKASVLLDYSPGDTRLPPPDAAAILQAAVEMGFPADSLIAISVAEDALRKATRSGEELRDFSLSCDRDAEVRVDIAADKLSARLTLLKGRGAGRKLELSMVSQALSQHKLKGVKTDKLKADVIAFYKGGDAELRNYLLAEGKAPGRGKDRSLVFGVAFMPEAQVGEVMTTLSTAPGLSRAVPSLADFPLADVQRVALVKKGQEVARFSPPSPGANGIDVYGMTIAALPGNDPRLISFENLKIQKETVESEEDGLALVAEKDGVTKARVVPFRDGKITVSVGKDARTASVNLVPHHGLGRELTLTLAQEALAQAGVVQGIDLKELSAALAEARAGETIHARTVARAREPVPAGGVRMQWLIRLASGAAVSMRADGSADFKNQDRATIVVMGQPLLELQSIGAAGQDGVDVLGGVIAAPQEADIVEPPAHDDSIVEETADNGNRLFKAAKNGKLLFEKNFLTIDPVQKIAGDVGPVTGNIKFPGPVAIQGAVLSGYAVVSGGDVIVTGSVEASLVSADGFVQITEGIKGARKGTIRARKSIEASFAEQAMLLAVEDVRLKNSALLCNIKTNGKLVLQGEKGHLVGGLCRARKGIEVHNLGSENGAKTQISFGQDYLVKDAIEAEEREIEKIKSMILDSDRHMRAAEKEGGAGLDRIRQEKLRLVKLLEKHSLKVFELREKYEEHFPGEIVVRGKVFAGVVIESHNRFHEVRQTKQKIVFSFDPQLGRVVERPLK